MHIDGIFQINMIFLMFIESNYDFTSSISCVEFLIFETRVW